MSKNEVELKDLQDLAQEFNEVMSLSPVIPVDMSQKALIKELEMVSKELLETDENSISNKGKLVLKALEISAPWDKVVVKEKVVEEVVKEKVVEEVVKSKDEEEKKEVNSEEEKGEGENGKVKTVGKKKVKLEKGKKNVIKKEVKKEVKKEGNHNCKIEELDKKASKKIKLKKDAEVVKEVFKKIKSKSDKKEKEVTKGKLSRYGYPVGSQDALLDDLFYKGVTKEYAIKALMQMFSIKEKTASDKFRWQLWRLRKKVGVAIKLIDGVYTSSK